MRTRAPRRSFPWLADRRHERPAVLTVSRPSPELEREPGVDHPGPRAAFPADQLDRAVTPDRQPVERVARTVERTTGREADRRAARNPTRPDAAQVHEADRIATGRAELVDD